MSDSDPESDRSSEAVVESEVGSETDPQPESVGEEREETPPAGRPGDGAGAADTPTRRERLRSLGERLAGSYSVIVVVAVVIGLVLAPVVATVATQGSSGTVAVVPIEGGIDGDSAAAFTRALEQARSDPEVKAVVLVINSGGGSASASEGMYLEISKTAEEMPVVSSVDAIAASGAYHAAVGSDRIFVKPASLTGSVGVIFTPPPSLEPNDIILTTGPSKLSGGTERGWRYKTESVQEAFLSAVVEGRGDALEIPRERVATAELFSGAEAVDTGIADEFGTTRDAVEHAAAQAGLSSYDVEVIRPQSNATFLTRTAYLASDAPNRSMVSVRYFIGEETANQYPNFLMIPGGLVAEELAEPRPTPTANSTTMASQNGTDRAGTPGAPNASAAIEVGHGR